MSKVVVHRDFEGEHITSDSKVCWCRPVEYDPNDPHDLREAEDVIAETETVDG